MQGAYGQPVSKKKKKMLGHIKQRWKSSAEGGVGGACEGA